MLGEVSVVIPCYRQAHFLSEAIESALRQTYHPIEVVVVDDGSPDATSEVAARYAGVRCVRQPNRGLPAARNAGLRASLGAYVVFLDADDRLLPNALEIGAAVLDAHREAAFAVGLHRRIAADGSPLPTRRRARVDGDYYASLVRRCWIVASTVTYRRAALERVGGFDETLRFAEDYDVYLRLARRFPIVDHYTEVSEYRQHPGSLSKNAPAMLAATLMVLRRHRPGPGASAAHRDAYRARENAVWYYEYLLANALDDLKHRRWRPGTRALFAYARHLPQHRHYAIMRLGTPLRLAARALRHIAQRAG